MKLKLDIFREALTAVNAAVNDGKVGITADDNDLVVYGQKPDGFLISRKIKGVDNLMPLGNVILNYSFVRASLAFFEGDDLYIEKKENSLFFHTEDGVDYARMEVPFILGGIPYDDKSGEKYVDTISIKYLSQYVNKTSHALELMKFAQTGSDCRKSSFFFQTDGENISLTTTDGHRVSLRSGKMGETKYSFVIPGDYLRAAAAQLGNLVRFDVPESKKILRIMDNDTLIVLPTISERYFNLDKVIEGSYAGEERFTLKRNSLISACEMISILSDKATFMIDTDKLIVSGTDKSALNERTIAIKNNGKNKTFIAVTRFMVDALKSFSSENVNIVVTENMCNITACEEGKKKEGKAVELVLLCRS